MNAGDEEDEAVDPSEVEEPAPLKHLNVYDPFSELTEIDKEIFMMRSMGYSYTSIGKIFKKKTSNVKEIINRVSNYLKDHDVTIDREYYLTNFTVKLDLIERETWRVYNKAGIEKDFKAQLSAIHQLIAIQRDRTKQLMDLGFLDKHGVKALDKLPKEIQRDKNVVDVEAEDMSHHPSSLLDFWDGVDKDKVAQAILQAQLTELAPPEPPEDEEEGEESQTKESPDSPSG